MNRRKECWVRKVHVIIHYDVEKADYRYAEASDQSDCC